MRSTAYLRSAAAILEVYDGSLPLAAWLKVYFKTHKKFGSTDRREVAHLCYCFYRMGRVFNNRTIEEKLRIANFFCAASANRVLEEQDPAWIDKVSASLQEKLQLLNAEDAAKDFFSFASRLSPFIDAKALSLSMPVQPDLFLRLRPGKEESVRRKLLAAGLSFREINAQCLALPNGSKVEELVALDREAVVQDRNSQHTLNGLLACVDGRAGLRIWDCCAASGGKSILFHDHFPHAQLWVSDVRESIIRNLRNRLARAGIAGYHAQVLDAARQVLPFPVDAVICDAPCSGSGTWGRTPEQLYFFREAKIEAYAALQKQIALNAVRALKPGGCFVYITCSVFAAENEEVVAELQARSGLELISMQYLKGYAQKADTLFAAVLVMR